MNNNQTRLPLAETLDAFLAGAPAYFCIPGHRFERGVSGELTRRFGDGVFRYDLTEANGLDDLHNATGPIREAQELAAELYGAEKTWFLVNGSTCGNEAMLLATLREGDTVLAARNVHQSVVSGMVMSGARPVWLFPEFDENWGFYTHIAPETVERALAEHPAAKAVILTSPTYYGTLSDIRRIGDLCHERNIPLLVDEAHGSHLYFSDRLPKGALQNGADAVVMSTHKTVGGMTQSAMLHAGSERISPSGVDAALRMVMTSSPSYVLMTALDAARAQLALEGRAMTERAADLAMELRKGLSNIEQISVFGGCEEKTLLEKRIDAARVVFSAKAAGIGGHALSNLMYETGGISFEMADSENVVAVVTGANTNEDIQRLLKTLRKVLAENGNAGMKPAEIARMKRYAGEIRSVDVVYTTREAYFARREMVPLSACEGRISAVSIAPYPPGIPVVNPGERISRETADILKLCRETKIPVHGYGENNLEQIPVIRE